MVVRVERGPHTTEDKFLNLVYWFFIMFTFEGECIILYDYQITGASHDDSALSLSPFVSNG